SNKDKDKLRAQNDQRVAQAYGVSEAEFAHLLRSFKVMANKRPEYLALLLTLEQLASFDSARHGGEVMQ
ncbi:MAG: hypothetical protein Q8O37_02235, partial [Sulfuricellaceae bacterium]|nr:hypothetical protein [Sulfuricellaceae bacterium]